MVGNAPQSRFILGCLALTIVLGLRVGAFGIVSVGILAVLLVNLIVGTLVFLMVIFTPFLLLPFHNDP